MNVLRAVSGSYCVIEIRPGPNGAYIDARRGHRIDDFGLSEPSGFTQVEVVVAGHVAHRESICDDKAPARLCELARHYA